jgi:Rrf2 family protein
MRVSFRGLYALKALLHLAGKEGGELVKIREIAEDEEIPEKFLEAILLVLKNARIVASQRGREGGYRLKRAPADVTIGEVVRLIDGPLAPFGDAAELQHRVKTEPRHAGLFDLFLDVRNAASDILDHTSLADVVARDRAHARKRSAARSKGG